MNDYQKIIGNRYGRLVVTEFIGRNKNSKAIFKCICDCGNLTETLYDYLKNGDTKSCGCYGADQRRKAATKHGQSRKHNPEYEIWKAMKGRCYNKNNAGYPDYGGRGIVVCDEWKNSFIAFIQDMGERPSVDHSIDRYPNKNGNYEKSNCRWATDDQQSRNKRNNRLFTHDERTMIMEDWAKYFGVHQTTLIEHLETKTFDTIFNFYAKKEDARLSKIRQGITPAKNFFRQKGTVEN